MYRLPDTESSSCKFDVFTYRLCIALYRACIKLVSPVMYRTCIVNVSYCVSTYGSCAYRIMYRFMNHPGSVSCIVVCILCVSQLMECECCRSSTSRIAACIACVSPAYR